MHVATDDVKRICIYIYVMIIKVNILWIEGHTSTQVVLGEEALLKKLNIYEKENERLKRLLAEVCVYT